MSGWGGARWPRASIGLPARLVWLRWRASAHACSSCKNRKSKARFLVCRAGEHLPSASDLHQWRFPTAAANPGRKSDPNLLAGQCTTRTVTADAPPLCCLRTPPAASIPCSSACYIITGDLIEKNVLAGTNRREAMSAAGPAPVCRINPQQWCQWSDPRRLGWPAIWLRALCRSAEQICPRAAPQPETSSSISRPLFKTADVDDFRNSQTSSLWPDPLSDTPP